MKNYKLDANCGNTFDNVSLRAKDIATNARKELIVEFDFNGVKCLVSKNTDLALLWRDYKNAHLMNWKKVGHGCVAEYSEAIVKKLYKRQQASENRQRLQEIGYRKKEEAERKLFDKKVVGIEMEVSDTAAWTECKEQNTDPYGACCVQYAEGWAKVMQAEISKGKSVKDCAEKASHELSFLGITGFMYGCAVAMLSKCWKYGEDLRKWHNKEYNHEGEGVVNPAIITIG